MPANPIEITLHTTSLTYQVPAFIPSEIRCTALTYVDSIESCPPTDTSCSIGSSRFNFDDSSLLFTISAGTLFESLHGIYEIKISATSADVTETAIFDVTFNVCENSLSHTGSIEDQRYIVGDTALTFTVPSFIFTPSICASSSTTTLTVDDPSVTAVAFDPITHELTVEELLDIEFAGGKSPPF